MLLLCDGDLAEATPPAEITPDMLPAFYAAQAAYREQIAAVQAELGVSEAAAMDYFDPFEALVVEGADDLVPGGELCDRLGVEGDLVTALLARLEYVRPVPGGAYLELLLDLHDAGGTLVYVPTALTVGLSLKCDEEDALCARLEH